MIKLLVDEAYAFDYLSILDIKKNINQINYTNWEICKENLSYEIGKDTIEEILTSEEYKKMLEVNKLTFDAVEKARYGGNITAKEVDAANLQRHKRKLELQRKFFDNNLTEYKT